MSHKAAMQLLGEQLAQRKLMGYVSGKVLDGHKTDFMWKSLKFAVVITKTPGDTFQSDWMVYQVTPNFVRNGEAIQLIQMLIKSRRNQRNEKVQ